MQVKKPRPLVDATFSLVFAATALLLLPTDGFLPATIAFLIPATDELLVSAEDWLVPATDEFPRETDWLVPSEADGLVPVKQNDVSYSSLNIIPS